MYAVCLQAGMGRVSSAVVFISSRRSDAVLASHTKVLPGGKQATHNSAFDFDSDSGDEVNFQNLSRLDDHDDSEDEAVVFSVR